MYQSATIDDVSPLAAVGYVRNRNDAVIAFSLDEEDEDRACPPGNSKKYQSLSSATQLKVGISNSTSQEWRNQSKQPHSSASSTIYTTSRSVW